MPAGGVLMNSERRIAVLFGGLSREREVSLVSGEMCAKALEAIGFQVNLIDAGVDLAGELAKSSPDIVFNALHGQWGEDGCVQGLLETMQLPYTHSGVCASAVAMNKHMSKNLLAEIGIRAPESCLVPVSELGEMHPGKAPYVVKPINEGSSVGVQIIRRGSNKPARLFPEYDELVMVEEYVPGRELTISVLNNQALTVTEIVTDDWYDYSAKYAVEGSRHLLPAPIPEEVFEACLEIAELAHRTLGCRGLSRTDLRWHEERGLAGLYFLEINTQPGMTPTSLSPEQAAYVGISFEKLCFVLASEASCGR